MRRGTIYSSSIIYHYRTYTAEKCIEIEKKLIQNQKKPKLLCCIVLKAVGELERRGRAHTIMECGICKRIEIKTKT